MSLVLVLLAILFFALIMLSIALHEIGHLLPAKLFGVKVKQYFVGFGRTLWSTTRGETEYGVKAIPLGGYVRLLGMYPPGKGVAWPKQKPSFQDDDGDPGGEQSSKGWLTRVADGARSYEYQEITEEDDGRLLWQKPVWQRVIVMFGGVGMNLLLAFLIFLGINAIHGTYQPTLTVGHVSDCIIPQDRQPAECKEGDRPTPASEAGLQEGDQLVSFNGVELNNWDQMGDLIRDNRDHEAKIVVERDGEKVTLPTVNTVLNNVPHRLDPTKTIEVGFLGLSPTDELVRGGVGTTASQMWDMTRMSAIALADFPARVYHVAADMVTGSPRDQNSPISILGASRVAGEIGVAGELQPGERIASWLSLLGSVNLFVALLNLVPLPPLDGGHIAGALYEGARRWLAKVRNRPDPGPADTAKLLPVAYLVGGLLLLGGVVLIIADIINPIQLF